MEGAICRNHKGLVTGATSLPAEDGRVIVLCEGSQTLSSSAVRLGLSCTGIQGSYYIKDLPAA